MNLHELGDEVDSPIDSSSMTDDDDINQDLDDMLQKKSIKEPVKSFTYTYFRYPILLIVLNALIIDLFIYIFLRWVIKCVERITSSVYYRKTKWKDELKKCKSYREWKIKIRNSEFENDKAWKAEPRSPYYDWELILGMTSKLNSLRKRANISEEKRCKKLAETLLQSGIKYNLGGIYHERLHFISGTKNCIEKYSKEVKKCLKTLLHSKQMTLDEKKKFFKMASRIYGRTALCLSGGAAFGFYHLGVIKCMVENNCLPRIISGSGAVMAAFACTRTDEELLEELSKPAIHETFQAFPKGDNFYQKMCRYLKTGNVIDSHDAANRIQKICKGNLTFLEAYQRTGKILNITVVSEDENKPAQLLNYLTTPNVIIYTAVLASGLIAPVALMCKRKDTSAMPSDDEGNNNTKEIRVFKELGKRWRDGSFQLDIPTEKLNQLLNTQFTVVSQVNPAITLFFYERHDTLMSGGSKAGVFFRGGFIASLVELYIKLDMRRWLRILKSLYLLPNWLQLDWSLLFLQPFHGNITFYPFFRLADYFYVLSNPSKASMDNYLTNGQRMVWPKMFSIKQRLRIEKLLDQGMDAVLMRQRDADPQSFDVYEIEKQKLSE